MTTGVSGDGRRATGAARGRGVGLLVGRVAGRVAGLMAASHPVPSLAITVLTTLLALRVSPTGTALALGAATMLAVQMSIGWSNDALDAPRDVAAGRVDKPIVGGAVPVLGVWTAALVALLAALALSWAVGPVTMALSAVVLGAGWAYNAGLKSSPASGLMYVAGFAPLPAFATSLLPAHPLPRWEATVAAALIGLGGHFANVLPDLAGDRATGVEGLPQRVAERYGPAAVRGAALALLLAASALLAGSALAAGWRRGWIAVAGLAVAAVLAATGGRAAGRTPFLTVFAIAAVDVGVLLGAGPVML